MKVSLARFPLLAASLVAVTACVLSPAPSGCEPESAKPAATSPAPDIAALRWAAEQGNAAAQSNLGVCYYLGQGVAQDYAEAVKWYRKSAEQGNAIAQGMLGLCYANGQGVAQNYVQAHMWYNLAAAAGNEEARKGRDGVAAHMAPAQIAEAQRLASQWKPKKQP